MMVIAILGLATFLLRGGWRRLTGGLTLPLSALGAGMAGYQSWLQTQPPGNITCAGVEPEAIESLVEWLGQQVPELLLATGFCADEELVILGPSLANWAPIAFIVFFGVALRACLMPAESPD
ncbi:MAG: disulfide bond formation protein B [Thiobacillaceae bacterium]